MSRVHGRGRAQLAPRVGGFGDRSGRSRSVVPRSAFALAVGGLIIIAVRREPDHRLRRDAEFRVQGRDELRLRPVIATPLIFSALAVSVCFKGGLFNIGVEGQFLVGMVTASWAALTLDFLPGPLAARHGAPVRMLGGMAYAAIPGILKVKTGAHEVVTTIMMNGIAVSLVA